MSALTKVITDGRLVMGKSKFGRQSRKSVTVNYYGGCTYIHLHNFKNSKSFSLGIEEWEELFEILYDSLPKVDERFQREDANTSNDEDSASLILTKKLKMDSGSTDSNEGDDDDDNNPKKRKITIVSSDETDDDDKDDALAGKAKQLEVLIIFNNYIVTLKKKEMNKKKKKKKKTSEKKKDLVCWVTLGLHHIPHTEDLPVTPTVGQGLEFYLLPHNYFDEDPAMGSSDSVRIELVDKEDIKKGLKVVEYGNRDKEHCYVKKRYDYEDIKKNPQLLFDNE